jgi:uncharacterized membrane protein
MQASEKAHLREGVFRVSITLKGLHAVLELVAGAALFAISPDFILRVIALLTQDELAEDPRDRVANYLLEAAKHVSISSERFAAIYLLGHGLIKLVLVIALLKSKRWAYPAAMIMFGAFILYQLYRFTLTRSPGLIALSLFDVLVLWLIWLEYRALKV